MSEVKKQNFTLFALPAVLYSKLNGILAGTKYQSIGSLSFSEEEQIVLVSEYNLDLWMDIKLQRGRRGKEVTKAIFDLYHLMIGEKGNETKLPHLRFAIDFFGGIPFEEIRISYLRQPQVDKVFVLEEGKIGEEREGELDAYFYTLSWFQLLEGRGRVLAGSKFR